MLEKTKNVLKEDRIIIIYYSSKFTMKNLHFINNAYTNLITRFSFAIYFEMDDLN
mgnify:CR=1 FL=1